MTGETNTPELKATGTYDKQEYLFYEFPNGNPPRRDDKPGQIKAFVREGFSEYRVPFDKLPTADLQEKFVALTGRKADEIGVVVLG
jgi:hypothetical protein